ncbi:MAG: hypothetical protein KC613_22325, partial [Myxococcales bacterium]|nr:hypothetical protein [Myxococcales bacterium]
AARPAAEPSGNPIQRGVGRLAQQIAQTVGGQQDAVDGFKRIAVLPFDAIDDTARELKLGRISSELLGSRLALDPAILQVERSRLDALVEELERQKKDVAKGAASVGRLLGASSVVLGSVSTVGSDFVVAARVVDTRTGRILTAADQNFPRAGMVALSKDVIEVKSKGGAAARSAALPGWGQLYNGDTARGVTYLALFGGLAAGAITSAVLGKTAADEYNENRADTVDRREDANAHFERTNWMLAGLGAVWLVSVVDAYVTGVDAETINLDLAPAVGGGATAGLSGTF